jgi:MFS family permease
MFSKIDRQVWLLTIGSMINILGVSIAFPYVSLYLFKYRGVPMGDVGLALMLASAIGGFAMIGAGKLCDAIGRKIVLNFGLLLQVASYCLLGYSVMEKMDLPYFIVFFILTQVASGISRNIPMVMVADVVCAEEQNEAYSFLKIGSNVGFAIGPLAGGLLAMYSYGMLFYATAVLSAIYVIFSALLLKETRPAASGHCDTVPAASAYKDAPFMVFCIVGAVLFVVYAQMFTTFGSFAGGVIGVPESEIGMMFSLNGIMIVLLQYPVTRIFSRFRLTTSLAIGSLLYAAGFGMVGLCTDAYQLAACIGVITLGEIVFSPPSMTIVAHMSSPENRGIYMSVSGFFTGAGFAVGPLIGGTLMDIFSAKLEVMWAVIGFFAMICVIGFLYLRTAVTKELDNAV